MQYRRLPSLGADRIAEDPQKQDIAAKVEQAAVEPHVAEEALETPASQHQVAGNARDFPMFPASRLMRQARDVAGSCCCESA